MLLRQRRGHRRERRHRDGLELLDRRLGIARLFGEHLAQLLDVQKLQLDQVRPQPAAVDHLSLEALVELGLSDEALSDQKGTELFRHEAADSRRLPGRSGCGFSSGSVRVLGQETAQGRAHQNLKIHQQRPVLDVVQIVLDPLLDGRLPAQPVDLRPTRNARLHLVSQVVAGNLPLELLDEDRALGTRPHQAHVAAQHVEELRQFVDGVLAQEGANGRAPRVLQAGHPGAGHLRVRAHGAELEDGEGAPIDAHALLGIENGPPAGELHQQRRHQHEGGRQRDGHQREHDVEGALGHPAPAIHRVALEADDGQPPKLLQPAIEGDVLVEVRHHLHIHGAQRQLLHEVLHHQLLRERQRDDDLVHGPDIEDALHLADLPQHGRAPHPPSHLGRILRKHPHHPEAQLAVLSHRLDDPAAQRSLADDEDGLQVVAAPPHFRERHPEHQPRHRDEHQGVAQKQRQREPGVALAGEVGERHQDERRGDGGLEDREHLPEVGARAVGDVEPRLVEGVGEDGQRHRQRDGRLLQRRNAILDGDEPNEARGVRQPERHRQHADVGGNLDGRVETLETTEHARTPVACQLPAAPVQIPRPHPLAPRHATASGRVRHVTRKAP
ncbi:hypothetical protein STIAU_7234 [Stigmatella aurantiaca DW4/3-1]|uniref:Uncharacterized protein n=1 Tax=Stigmatella aurantiaca (strain DW4/3-1) TaxID=378806 RepID=Q08MQ1_STIAD|nr:hypothetical protein STIAU_7234 [Stigmatella aurantiaca DW4/3-1]